MKGTLGLDLVNTRTAESLAVKIDAAIVLSNVLTLLRVFAIPILILAKFEGEAYQFAINLLQGSKIWWPSSTATTIG